MADLKLDLNPATPYDLDLTGADLAIVVGDDAIVQHLTIRFQFFKGEWDYDRRVGIPYLTDILIKNPSVADVRNIFSQTILTTPGIAEIQELSLDIDPTTRVGTVDFVAVKDDGGILDFSTAFILPGGVNETETETT